MLVVPFLPLGEVDVGVSVSGAAARDRRWGAGWGERKEGSGESDAPVLTVPILFAFNCSLSWAVSACLFMPSTVSLLDGTPFEGRRRPSPLPLRNDVHVRGTWSWKLDLISLECR